MPVELYKVVHLIGLILAFMAVGGMCLATPSADGRKFPKIAGASHGIGMLLALIGGFGMLAKLHLGFPWWIGVKLLIWLAVGAAPAVISRAPERRIAVWWGVLGLALIAASLGVFQP